MMVVRQEINYLRPIRFSIRALLTRTWFSHIGTSSFTMETQLIDEGSLAADAKSVGCVSIKNRALLVRFRPNSAAHRRAPRKIREAPWRPRRVPSC